MFFLDDNKVFVHPIYCSTSLPIKLFYMKALLILKLYSKAAPFIVCETNRHGKTEKHRTTKSTILKFGDLESLSQH